MLVEVNGLVIRRVDLSETDRLITLFTAENGKMTVYAKGSRALKSRYLAATEMFCYGNFILYQRGERYWVKEVVLTESFFALRNDLGRMALAAYLCDVADDVVEVNAPEPELLRLVLNSLYAITQGNYALALIKAVFEMRAAALLGFMPQAEGCSVCGKKEGAFVLDIMEGTLLCKECQETGAPDPYEEGHAHILCPVSAGAHAILLYVLSCAAERVFAFRAAPADLGCFAVLSEQYLIHHLERNFRSLDFYREIAQES